MNIIGILAATAIHAFSSYRDKARIALPRADLRNIQCAMEMLASDTENWPLQLSCANTMQKIADGEEYKMPATIDDPAILGEIATALSGVGYPKDA